jgi:hypothetical protein
MLPDFNGLVHQPSGRTDLRSLEHRSDNNSSDRQSFNERDRAAFPENRAALSPEDLAFYELWATLPSWSPIQLINGTWQTLKSQSGKKVPLTLNAIERAYRLDKILGKRFGQLTNYLMLDIDAGSLYHPRNGGLQPILAALKKLGLCRCLLIQSSDSTGIHLYFPLSAAVNSWALANAAHAVLSAAGIRITGGQCELFPNKKALGAQHNGHRLPLQKGSYLLNDDYAIVSNSKADFLQQWQLAASGQDTDTLTQAITAKAPLPAQRRAYTGALPPIAWTAFGDSNEVMKALVNYGDRYLGLKNVVDLAEWVIAVAPQLPGFSQFASKESKDDLLRRDWAYRWAKSHFRSARNYQASISPDHNAEVEKEAKWRVMATLERLGDVSSLGIKKLWKVISTTAKEWFGTGISWKVFNKYRDLILAHVQNTGVLGLSSGIQADVNCLSQEHLMPAESGADLGLEKAADKLRTGGCVTPIQNQALNPSPPPIQEGGQIEPAPLKMTVDNPVDLAPGDEVLIKLPGCPMNGVKTKVRGKTKDELQRRVYRLYYRLHGQYMTLPIECLEVVSTTKRPSAVETAIRATAAQLFTVLGNANPFVGPGLWEVKRGDVPAQAWERLRRIVGVA